MYLEGEKDSTGKIYLMFMTLSLYVNVNICTDICTCVQKSEQKLIQICAMIKNAEKLIKTNSFSSCTSKFIRYVIHVNFVCQVLMRKVAV